MTAADVPLRDPPLRAPREDGAALIDPPVADAARLVAANQALAKSWDRASGASFAKWRHDARMDLLAGIAADNDRPWTVEEQRTKLARPFILAGHQPSLFHPGVWLKHFLSDRIAQKVHGTAINLLVDNDTVRLAGIRVPGGTAQSPQLIDVLLDSPAPEMPWEERAIIDPDTFRSFASRVHAAFQPLCPPQSRRQPLLIDSVWQHATDHAALPGNPALGQCLSHGRHAVERSLGLKALEAPISQICRFGCMTDFLEHLLSRWEELHPIYNAALREYRSVNHIRSRNHPAPDLVADGQWLETPLWIWDRANPQRRRAFVRRLQHGYELTDRGSIRINHVDAATDAKVRPRALITTMFARLILSDLFIHGIGGAKYDELTDVLIRRFFGIEPPAYVTATATFRLPIERPQVTEDDVRAIERRIRDTVHHGETFADELAGNRGSELNQLAAEKKELIAAGWNEKQKKAWHDRVAACNDRMSALLDEVRQRLVQERAQRLADLHAANLLAQREFSFVLFPEETLPRVLLDLCAAKP